jgi:hypothetical protein
LAALDSSTYLDDLVAGEVTAALYVNIYVFNTVRWTAAAGLMQVCKQCRDGAMHSTG